VNWRSHFQFEFQKISSALLRDGLLEVPQVNLKMVKLSMHIGHHLVKRFLHRPITYKMYYRADIGANISFWW